MRNALKIDVDVARAVPIAVDRAFARWATKHLGDRRRQFVGSCPAERIVMHVAGNEAGGDGVFDVCEAVHAMGAGVDAADRSGGGGDCHNSCAALRA
eukprot:ANDGO_06567.mRNA.1 hypothetical protein